MITLTVQGFLCQQYYGQTQKMSTRMTRMVLKYYVDLLGLLLQNVKCGEGVYFPYSLFLVKAKMEGITWCAVLAPEIFMQKLYSVCNNTL